MYNTYPSLRIDIESINHYQKYNVGYLEYGIIDEVVVSTAVTLPNEKNFSRRH